MATAFITGATSGIGRAMAVALSEAGYAVGRSKSALEDLRAARPGITPIAGVSKNSVESLSRLYWDKFGIETACLRIFSSFPEPADRRMLWWYPSFADCVRLAEAALTALRVGHTISFGISDNKLKMVDNSGADHIGFIPQNSAEPFRATVEARVPVPDPKAPSVKYLGGWFCELGHLDDEAKS